MRVAFDTSVLVAGSIVGHRHERRAAVWLDAARRGDIEGCVTAHALAEVWATLTAIPVEPRIDPARVTDLVASLEAVLERVVLGAADYRAAMKRCGERGRVSGAIYDALHLVAAERKRCDIQLTFNTRHFVALQAGDAPRILAPPDPPRVAF